MSAAPDTFGLRVLRGRTIMGTWKEWAPPLQFEALGYYSPPQAEDRRERGYSRGAPEQGESFDLLALCFEGVDLMPFIEEFDGSGAFVEGLTEAILKQRREGR